MMPSKNLSHIEPQSLSAVFLETVQEDRDDLAPLTPFMIHTAKLARILDSALRDPEERAKFVYWFFDTYQRLRIPYRWPVPSRLLAWLNTPAERHSRYGPRDTRRDLYVTRFMSHVWSQHKKDINPDLSNSCLRFLTWFAFECIPAWNLPPALLPDALLSILNEPVRGESVPVTLGMALRAQVLHPARFSGFESADDAVLLAMSFESATDALRTSDPRLLPPFVTRFWSGRAEKDADLTRYEYVAARSWCPAWAPPAGWKSPDYAAARTWFQAQYVSEFPNTDIFSEPQEIAGAAVSGSLDALRPASKMIFVHRDLETVSGLSRAGKIATDALRRASLPVTEVNFGFRRSSTEMEFQENGRQFCAADSAIHILNVNPELVPECLASNLSKIAESDYIIGQFYWELSDISSWHECALSLVDELWVASEYLRELYSRRVRVPVIVMGQAVEVPVASASVKRSSLGLPDDAYLFFFSFDAGSITERKNPLAAVTAFLEAFPKGSEKVALVIKTKNTNTVTTKHDSVHWSAVRRSAAKDRRITIIDRELSDSHLAALHEASDCYVSLHRSEGFGFGPADAMARGKPVIVTAYSGVTDFCTPETAFLVDFTLRPVENGAYPYMDSDRTYHWADPNLHTASVHMRHLYESPDQGARIGARARSLISERYSVTALSDRYRARLAALGAFEHA
jgi:glycosyltransferase involved in cell wall biosynthesis